MAEELVPLCPQKTTLWAGEGGKALLPGVVGYEKDPSPARFWFPPVPRPEYRLLRWGFSDRRCKFCIRNLRSTFSAKINYFPRRVSRVRGSPCNHGGGEKKSQLFMRTSGLVWERTGISQGRCEFRRTDLKHFWYERRGKWRKEAVTHWNGSRRRLSFAGRTGGDCASEWLENNNNSKDGIGVGHL